jgi:hypothetical protein
MGNSEAWGYASISSQSWRSSPRRWGAEAKRLASQSAAEGRASTRPRRPAAQGPRVRTDRAVALANRVNRRSTRAVAPALQAARGSAADRAALAVAATPRARAVAPAAATAGRPRTAGPVSAAASAAVQRRARTTRRARAASRATGVAGRPTTVAPASRLTSAEVVAPGGAAGATASICRRASSWATTAARRRPAVAMSFHAVRATRPRCAAAAGSIAVDRPTLGWTGADGSSACPGHVRVCPAARAVRAATGVAESCNARFAVRSSTAAAAGQGCAAPDPPTAARARR